MNLNGYIDECVRKLAGSRSVPHFESVISGIERQLMEWKLEGDHREAFWRDVAERYEKAPKPLLEDTTAAEKLFALHSVASKMLAAARQNSAAAAATRK